MNRFNPFLAVVPQRLIRPRLLPSTKMSHSLILITWICALIPPNATQTPVREFCHWETLEAHCPHDHVIVIEQARYGRMRIGKCVSEEYGHVGCFADVTTFLDFQCSGKRECQVPVTSFVQENIRPCPKDVTSYMEAAYHCQRVHQLPVGQQCIGVQDLHLEGGQGYISSLVTNPTSSKLPCTWKLSAEPGQTFNLTLMDFGVYLNDKRRDPRSFCHRYAIIKDLKGSGQREVTVCADVQRQRHLYVSKGNDIQVQLFGPNVEDYQPRFIIHYEVLGCPNLPVIPSLQVSRKNEKATVSCQNSERSWTLTCQQNKWIGGYGNCSASVKAPAAPEQSSVWQALFGDGWSSPKGLAVVVALGVLLGILIGALLLCVMIMILKKRSSKNPDNKLTTIHQRATPEDIESHDLDQDYFREKLLCIDGEPDLVTPPKCLCPTDDTTHLSSQEPNNLHGTLRSVYLYPTNGRGGTHLYETTAYKDIIT